MREDLVFPKPLLIFMADVPDAGSAKTGLGLKDWRPEWCVAQWRMDGCGVDLGLQEFNPVQAKAAGVKTLVLGAAPDGGKIPDHWIPKLLEAIATGLHIASGLHDLLCDRDELRTAASLHGVTLFDARRPPTGLTLPTGGGKRRTGHRVLTVGTDCACGKKYTALTLEREMQRRNLKADFVATGQTGVMISGGGIAIDAVVSDFVAGAVEMLSPSAESDHWYVIEGQGSLYHPAYAGVTLGLLHGAQADSLILCHDPRRTHIDYLPDYPIPALREAIDLYEHLGRLTSPHIKVRGISLITAGMLESDRMRCISSIEDLTQLPVTDPIALGVQALVDEILRAT